MVALAHLSEATRSCQEGHAGDFALVVKTAKEIPSKKHWDRFRADPLLFLLQTGLSQMVVKLQ